MALATRQRGPMSHGAGLPGGPVALSLRRVEKKGQKVYVYRPSSVGKACRKSCISKHSAAR